MNDPIRGQTFVVGVNGSNDSDRALQWAATLAATTGAGILAVHVLTYNRELLQDLTLDTMRLWRRQLRRDLETSWVEALQTAGVNYRCALVEADTPAAGLLETAEAAGADLIIVGAPPAGLVGRLMTSTAAKLLYRAHQPVVIVPATVASNETTTQSRAILR